MSARAPSGKIISAVDLDLTSLDEFEPVSKGGFFLLLNEQQQPLRPSPACNLAYLLHWSCIDRFILLLDFIHSPHYRHHHSFLACQAELEALRDAIGAPAVPLQPKKRAVSACNLHASAFHDIH